MTTSAQTRRLLLAAMIASTVGCASGGGRFSSFALSAKSDPPASETAVVHSLSDDEPNGSLTSSVTKLTEGTRGQISSMGMAVKSAYGKAHHAVAGVFSPSQSDGDPLSLENMPQSIGPDVYVTNGQMWETAGDTSKAMQSYAQALESEPNNAAALASVARLHRKLENLDQSVEYFQKAIAAAPSEAALYSDFGMTLSEMGRHREAADQLRKAIAISPGTKRFSNNLAIVLMNAGQPEAAFTAMKTALEPHKAHFNMAYLYYQHQQLDPARQHLGQALQIDPNMQAARELLSKLGGDQMTDAYGAVQQAGQAVQQAGQLAERVAALATPAAATPASPSANAPSANAPSANAPSANAPSANAPAANATSGSPAPAEAAPATADGGGYQLPPGVAQ